MRGLQTLIRLHRMKLDEQRRQLIQLETVREQLAAQIVQLDREVAEEAQTAGAAADCGLMLGSYVQSSLVRRRRLEQSVADVDGRIMEVKDHVAEAFRELKRFELAEQQRARRAAVEARRRDRNREDEVAIEMFRRRQDTATG